MNQCSGWYNFSRPSNCTMSSYVCSPWKLFACRLPIKRHVVCSNRIGSRSIHFKSWRIIYTYTQHAIMYYLPPSSDSHSTLIVESTRDKLTTSRQSEMKSDGFFIIGQGIGPPIAFACFSTSTFDIGWAAAAEAVAGGLKVFCTLGIGALFELRGNISTCITREYHRMKQVLILKRGWCSSRGYVYSCVFVLQKVAVTFWQEIVVQQTCQGEGVMPCVSIG